MDVEIICRRCGRKAQASTFKVDYMYKMAVCPTCIKERQSQEKKPVSKPEPASIHIQKNVFDEDAELEKAYLKKQEKLAKERENYVKVRLVEENKALYPCTKCGYKFKYNFETNRPVKCPFCGEPVKKITFT